jgi:phage shock protein PspC (stress-responsive transcriptional regulator)
VLDPRHPAGAPPQLVRADRGGWLAGVCAGLAPVRGLSAGWLRVAFVAGALVGGAGIALYIAFWLILPVEGEPAEGGGPARPRGIVVVAQACAGCAALAVLAAAGATATLFGFGWAVLAAAAAVLVAVLAGPRRLGPGWALLPVAALTLPAVAVAAGGLRLAPQAGPIVVAPSDGATLRSGVYTSGLGTMLVDLRRTALPAGGTIPLTIRAGVRRTIVALPADRCVRVEVTANVNPLVGRLGALLTGRTTPEFSDLMVFGRLYGPHSGTVVEPVSPAAHGPVLDIAFASQGGSLYVRDYPNTVDPDAQPDWPGYTVHVEPRPDIRGTPRKAAAGLLRRWRARRRVQERSQRAIDTLLPGACGAAAAHPAATHSPATHSPRRRRRTRR